MRFDGALGNIQIPSDFRVVTSLEKQIDDLPFPGAHLAELLFHKNTHLIDQTQAPKPGPSAHLDSGLCVSICNHAAKSGSRR